MWSQACSRAAAGGMQDASLEERRASLPAEVHEYKELYFQLMRRVARFTEELASITPTSAEEELQLRFFSGHMIFAHASCIFSACRPSPKLMCEPLADCTHCLYCRADAEEFQSLCELLYRGHQAWHLAHIVIKHLVPLPPSTYADLPFDLVHWIQEHDPLDLYVDIKRQTRITPFRECAKSHAYHFFHLCPTTCLQVCQKFQTSFMSDPICVCVCVCVCVGVQCQTEHQTRIGG